MHGPCPLIDLPSQLVIVAYPDPVVERYGYGPDSEYLECWLQIVGPSVAWMWKKLSRLSAGDEPHPVTVETADLLMSIGLGEGMRRNSAGARTVARMVSFDLAKRAGRDGSVLAVRRALPRLCEHQVRRLAPSARTYHDALAS